MRALEAKTGKRFGDPAEPLLVSVRSGAAVSMPGMMDTILNLGLNDEAVEGLARSTENPRFAYDSYRRLIQMYGGVVEGIDGHRFEQALADLKGERGATQDTDLTADDLRELLATFKRIFEAEAGRPFPQDAREQLRRAVRAVFESWDNPRAQVYRQRARDPRRPRHRRQRRPDGVRQQGRGLRHGRLLHARPLDRRAGPLRRVPRQRAGRGRRGRDPDSRADRADAERLPEAFEQLLETMARLERHYRDMQDIEFTVEEAPALPAPDPQREADGGRRAEGGGEHGRRRPDRQGGGGRAHRPRPARPAAAPDARPGEPSTRSSRRASTPRPGPRAGRSCSTPRPPSGAAGPASG